MVKNLTEEQQDVVNFLLKKSKKKDSETQKHVEDVDKEEIEELTRKIKEKIKVKKD
ncbi:MAG: hypothetical protein ISS23_00320 [Nanoarchaeota archaeon]|nr:hypothetical protein [Nanoarchaeota archaeon]